MNGYRFQLVLVINRLEAGDFGTYRCISKNSIGQAEEVVELYGGSPPLSPIPEMPTKMPTYSVYSHTPESEYEGEEEVAEVPGPATRSPRQRPTRHTLAPTYTRSPSGFLYRCSNTPHHQQGPQLHSCAIQGRGQQDHRPPPPAPPRCHCRSSMIRWTAQQLSVYVSDFQTIANKMYRVW